MSTETFITLTPAGFTVVATLEDGRSFSTKDTAGLIGRLDRQMRTAGVLRTGGYTSTDGIMIAPAAVLA